MTKRQFLTTLAASFATTPHFSHAEGLPLTKTFVGKDKFFAVVAKAQKNNWAAQPMGYRMGLIAMEFKDTPYVGFSLEIDDHVEAASANCNGLDCWTFFELVLGLARMLEQGKKEFLPQDLLEEILWTRYRGGVCTGNYLQRIHYLNEWWFENAARGTVQDLTKAWGVEKELKGRESREMTKLWQGYRYLKNNPQLRPKMAEIEQLINRLPVHYIPNAAVAGIESKLQTGDIVGIVTKSQGGVCSHVGMIVRTKDSPHPFLMHASSNFRKVVIEARISEYLGTYTAHMGIILARPLSTKYTQRDKAIYQQNLKKLTGGIMIDS